METSLNFLENLGPAIRDLRPFAAPQPGRLRKTLDRRDHNVAPPAGSTDAGPACVRGAPPAGSASLKARVVPRVTVVDSVRRVKKVAEKAQERSRKARLFGE